jgi:hypothetical protein
MRLSKDALIQLAERLHGEDWFTEGVSLIDSYEAMLKKRPHYERLTSSQQKEVLIQWYYHVENKKRSR